MRRWTQTFTGSLPRWRTNSRTTSRKRIRDSTGIGFLTLAGWAAGYWRPNTCDGCVVCGGGGRFVAGRSSPLCQGQSGLFEKLIQNSCKSLCGNDLRQLAAAARRNSFDSNNLRRFGPNFYLPPFYARLARYFMHVWHAIIFEKSPYWPLLGGVWA